MLVRKVREARYRIACDVLVQAANRRTPDGLKKEVIAYMHGYYELRSDGNGTEMPSE